MSKTKRVCLCVLAACALLSAALFQVETAGVAQAQAGGQAELSVTLNEKIVLEMSTSTVDFGAVDPGTVSSPRTVAARVYSNVPWDLTYTATVSPPDSINLNRVTWDTLSTFPNPKVLQTSGTFLTDQPLTSGSGASITHWYKFDAPWGTAPGTYKFTVTYTAAPSA